MALTLAKIEAVKFGDLEVVPKFGKEQELRVRNLKITEDNLEEVAEVMSQCFGAYAADVKDFMLKNLFIMDYTRLHIYLTQGQSGLDSFEKRLDSYMEKEMEKARSGAKND